MLYFILQALSIPIESLINHFREISETRIDQDKPEGSARASVRRSPIPEAQAVFSETKKGTSALIPCSDLHQFPWGQRGTMHFVQGREGRGRRWSFRLPVRRRWGSALMVT